MFYVLWLYNYSWRAFLKLHGKSQHFLLSVHLWLSLWCHTYVIGMCYLCQTYGIRITYLCFYSTMYVLLMWELCHICDTYMMLYQTHVIVMYYTSVIVMSDLCNTYVVDRLVIRISYVCATYVRLVWYLWYLYVYILLMSYLLNTRHQYDINMILVWYLLDPYVVAMRLMIRMWWLCNMSVLLILIPPSCIITNVTV